MSTGAAELSDPIPMESELSQAHALNRELEGRITGLQADIIEHQRAAVAGMRGVLELPDIRHAAMMGTLRTRDLYLGALASDFGRVMLERLRAAEERASGVEDSLRQRARLAQAWLEGAAKMRENAAKCAETFVNDETCPDDICIVTDPRDVAADIRALSLVPFTG